LPAALVGRTVKVDPKSVDTSTKRALGRNTALDTFSLRPERKVDEPLIIGLIKIIVVILGAGGRGGSGGRGRGGGGDWGVVRNYVS
jgi:hypothetical protein